MLGRKAWKGVVFFMGKRTNTAKWMEAHKRWQINVQKDGRRRSFYSSTPGRNGQRECNAKADAWLDENMTDNNLRVGNLFEDYIESLKLTTSKSNWSKVEGFGRNWINDSIGGKRICNVTEQDLQDIINKAYAKGLSKKTLMNLKATMTNFLKYCRKRKATILFPENLDIPKGAPVCEKRILQPDDLCTLFSSDTTLLYGKRVFDEYINAYRFQVLTGLRPGELIGLEWRDIKGNTVFVKRSVNAYKEVTKGKNENAVRCFALSSLALEVLDEQHQINQKGSIFDIPSLSVYEKRWVRYCQSNAIPHVTLYELRHTFISIAKNLSEGKVKALVGHSRNMDTFGVYGHEVTGEREETAKEINSIFANLLKSVL